MCQLILTISGGEKTDRGASSEKEEAEKWNGTITRIYLENMTDK